MNGNPAYQEEFREELLNGEFVAMSPRPMFNHNRVASNICRILQIGWRTAPARLLRTGWTSAWRRRTGLSPI